MFFAERTRRRVKFAVLVMAIYSSLVAAAVWLSPWTETDRVGNFLRWLFVVPTALIAWAVLEGFGTWLLGLQVWEKMPSAVRILLLVLLVVVVVTGIIAIHTMYGGNNAL